MRKIFHLSINYDIPFGQLISDSGVKVITYTGLDIEGFVDYSPHTATESICVIEESDCFLTPKEAFEEKEGFCSVGLRHLIEFCRNHPEELREKSVVVLGKIGHVKFPTTRFSLIAILGKKETPTIIILKPNGWISRTHFLTLYSRFHE